MTSLRAMQALLDVGDLGFVPHARTRTFHFAREENRP